MGPKGKRRIMKTFRLAEISLVDRPAQEGARVAILKRTGDNTRPDVLEKRLPKKNAGESKADFVSRFMSDSEMKKEYPDIDQRLAVANRQYGKRLAVTSTEDGHAHTVMLYPDIKVDPQPDGSYSEQRIGTTSWADEHTHDWVKDDAGNLIILEANGHSHSAAVMIKNDDISKAQFASSERERLAMSGGSYPIKNKADLSNAIHAFGRGKAEAAVAKHIKRRADALGLTDMLPKEGALADLLSKGEDSASASADTIGNTTGVQNMTPEEKAALEKAEQDNKRLQADLEKANKLAELSDDEKAYMKSLDEKDRDGFLAKSAEDRKAEVAADLAKRAESNPVVYTAADGTEFRKSDDQRLVQMAKDRDADRAELKKQREAAKRADLEKRAGIELPNLAGDSLTKAALLGAIDGISDEALRGKVTEMVKASDAGMGKAFARLGTTSAPAADGSATSQLDELVKRYAADNKVDEATAYAKVLETPEGARLYSEHRNNSITKAGR